MGKPSSAGKVLLKGILGIIIFMIIIGAMNIIAIFFTNPTYLSIVSFFNQNFWFIIVISILTLFGDFFAALRFPLNSPYPIFNAIAGTFWVWILFEMFKLIDELLGQNLTEIFAPFYSAAVVVIFLIIIVIGYTHVILSTRTRRQPKPEEKKKTVEWKKVKEEVKAETPKTKKKSKSKKKTVERKKK